MSPEYGGEDEVFRREDREQERKFYRGEGVN